MQQKYILVVNPISGGNDKKELINAVRTYGAEAGIDLLIFETNGEDDEKKLLQLFENEKPKRVIVAGGDGTIKMVAEALEAQEVILGIIPAGSANGLSANLNLPNTLEAQLEMAFFSDFIELDMVCINKKKSLHLSDIGLNAALIRNYENGSIRGKLGYALQAINTLTDEELSFNVQIKANGTIIETNAKMVVIANAQKYGTGVIINPLGVLNDGKFEIVVLKTFSLAVLGKILMSDLLLDKEDVDIISTDMATIQTDIPVHFQIDGEYCGEESKLDIQILPKCLKFAASTLGQ